jgi:hypothetical protein
MGCESWMALGWHRTKTLLYSPLSHFSTFANEYPPLRTRVTCPFGFLILKSADCLCIWIELAVRLRVKPLQGCSCHLFHGFRDGAGFKGESLPNYRWIEISGSILMWIASLTSRRPLHDRLLRRSAMQAGTFTKQAGRQPHLPTLRPLLSCVARRCQSR